MKKIYLLLIVQALFAVSCKKDSPPQTQLVQIYPLTNGILNLSVNGQLMDTQIDTVANTITAVIPDISDIHHLIINFSLASQVNAAINNTNTNSGSTIDVSNPIYLTVTSADKKRSSQFQLIIKKELDYFGLTGNIITEKSLIKNYGFYFDQFDGSASAGVNCGPAVSTMAIKWADSAFTKTPVDARNLYKPAGGWWTTQNVDDYLHFYGLNYKIDTLSNLESFVKTNIDKNNVIILCLDMYYVTYNSVSYQHVNKFYATSGPNWGHFLLVKGYKQTAGTFYLEIYDPYSSAVHYPTINTKVFEGQDRYYSSADIKKATDTWWPYGIIIAPKGQKVTASTSLKLNSIRHSIPLAVGR